MITLDRSLPFFFFSLSFPSYSLFLPPPFLSFFLLSSFRSRPLLPFLLSLLPSLLLYSPLFPPPLLSSFLFPFSLFLPPPTSPFSPLPLSQLQRAISDKDSAIAVVELQEGVGSPQAEMLKKERGKLMRELREKVRMSHKVYWYIASDGTRVCVCACRFKSD